MNTLQARLLVLVSLVLVIISAVSCAWYLTYRLKSVQQEVSHLGETLAEAGVGYEDIIFHYPVAKALTVKSVTVPGALFVPYGTISFDYGNIESTVIADAIKGTGEFHFSKFEGTFCPEDEEE